jgi:hypothetical protein
MTRTEEDYLDKRAHLIDGAYPDLIDAVQYRNQQELHLTPSYIDLRHDSTLIGTCSLQLGDVQQAREWFAKSVLFARAQLIESRNNWESLGPSIQKSLNRSLLRGLYAAILTGDTRLIDAVSEDILEFSDQYESTYLNEKWEYWTACFWQACTVASLVHEEQTTAREFREKYLALYEEQDHPITPDIHEGLLTSDEDQTRTALADRLAQHDAQSGDMYEWEEFVCITTAAHLLLARSRGIDIQAVDFDSDYLPDAIDAYELGDEIDLPRPEFVDEDLIPDQ